MDVTLAATSVTWDGSYPSDIYHPNPAMGGITGGSGCLSDADDATYIRGYSLYQHNLDAFDVQWEALTIPDGYEVTGYSHQFRLRSSVAAGTVFYIDIGFWDAGMHTALGADYSTEAIFFPFNGSDFGTDWTDHHVAHGPLADPFTSDALVAGAHTTFTIGERSPSGSDTYIDVSEMSLIVELSPVPAGGWAVNTVSMA